MTGTTDLSPEVTALLPGPGEAPRCEDFASRLGVSLHGTGLDVAMVVLVETPLPWPKPVFAHPRLAGLTSPFTSAVGPARILATRPSPTHPAPLKVTCFWRVGAAGRGVVLTPADQAELHECLAELVHIDPTRSRFVAREPAPARAVVVCTQGSHDVCCGAAGTRLIAQLELARPDLRVYPVSHMGGHRFAPTVLTLPDGRMWGRTSASDVEAIVDQTVAPAAVADRCRGWWGAAQGSAQAAELAVFATQPWGWNRRERAISVAAGQTADVCTVAAGADTWTVEVTVSRLVPTIACHAEGGLPAKAEPELAAHIVDVAPAP